MTTECLERQAQLTLNLDILSSSLGIAESWEGLIGEEENKTVKVWSRMSLNQVVIVQLLNCV